MDLALFSNEKLTALILYTSDAVFSKAFTRCQHLTDRINAFCGWSSQWCGCLTSSKTSRIHDENTCDFCM